MSMNTSQRIPCQVNSRIASKLRTASVRKKALYNCACGSVIAQGQKLLAVVGSSIRMNPNAPKKPDCTNHREVNELVPCGVVSPQPKRQKANATSKGSTR